MPESDPILQQRVSQLSPTETLRYMANLAHGLTVAARDYYEVGGTGLTNPAKVRSLNEMQHRVTGSLTELLSPGACTYTAPTLTEMLWERGQHAELGRLIEFIVEMALNQAKAS